MSEDRKDLIDELAAQLRDIYLHRRNICARLLRESDMLSESETVFVKTLHPRYDGGTDSRNQNYKPIWPRLASTSLSENIPPRAWVETLFALAFLFDHVPRPDDLNNPSVLKKSKNWKQWRSQDVYYTVRTEMQNALQELWDRQIMTGLPAARVARTIAADPDLAVSALVRYVLVYKQKQGDLVALLEPMAVLQYMPMADVYDSALGGHLPAQLRQRARAVMAEDANRGRF